MMPRSFSMIAAVLGVWKAGGCYVPIDPEYPAERKRYILSDSGTKLLITINEADWGRLLILKEKSDDRERGGIRQITSAASIVCSSFGLYHLYVRDDGPSKGDGRA